MTIDRIIHLLVTITLIEMMITFGLGVKIEELVSVVRNWRLVAQAMLANYVCVPAVAVGMLLLFRAQPMTAAGYLLLAVCPGAPYGPPFTSIAKGNVPVAVGLMVILAGSTAIVAPLLLQFLLLLMAGIGPLHIDSVKVVMTLLVTQFLPLCVGLSVCHWRPALALRLLKPAILASKILNLMSCGLILGTQFQTMLEIRLLGYVGMSVLLIASFVAGWLLGGPSRENRKTLTLTTSLRNIGVSLVIATGNFAGTPAVTAVMAYGIFEVLASLLLALWWGWRESASDSGNAVAASNTCPRQP